MVRLVRIIRWNSSAITLLAKLIRLGIQRLPFGVLDGAIWELAGRGGARWSRTAAVPLPPGAYLNPGTGVVHYAFIEAEAFGPYQRPDTLDAVKRRAAQIDFKAVFANASLAGLKHFAIEHDNAAAWGDSLAAARVSYRNLARILS